MSQGLPAFCKPDFMGGQLLGPIYNGDSVILLVESEDGQTLQYVNIDCDDSTDANVGTIIHAQDFGDVIPTLDQLPIFTIQYAGTKTSTIDVNSKGLASDPGLPYIMFTFNNISEIRKNNANCALSTTPGLESGAGFPAGPGLGTLTYGNPNLFLAPGTPMPIKLNAVDPSILSWWPSTKKTSGSNVQNNSSYVLALAGEKYTFEAVSSESNGPPIVIMEQSKNFDNPLKNFFIVPTSVFEASSDISGNNVCTGKRTTDDKALETGLCAIGCQGAYSNFNCSTSATTTSSTQIDCTQACTYAFTDENDAQDGCFYSYCTVNDGFCNSGMCKSSCSNYVPQLSRCEFSGNDYQCVQVETVTTEEEIDAFLGSLSPTTIAILVGVIVLIVIGIVLYVIYAWATAYNQGMKNLN